MKQNFTYERRGAVRASMREDWKPLQMDPALVEEHNNHNDDDNDKDDKSY